MVGGAIFGIVLWLRLDYWTREYLELNSKLERYLILIYITLAAGALIAAFSILGLIGACLKRKWLLIVYLSVVVIAMVLTVAAFVYGAIYRDELRNTLVSDSLLTEIIKNKYIEDRTSRFVRVVDIMQSELECCGGTNPMDYAESNWAKTIQSSNDQNSGTSMKSVPVPASCCKDYLKYQDRSKTCDMYSRDPKDDQKKSEDIWQTGCEINLQQFFDKYVVIVISIAAVFFVLQKSPYPSRGDHWDHYH
ncbi:unnamed protein product [Candidula unifasciata]|uniref:Tetraspanin n=1 Tax=Candidula unifasciata TaxID=100452 RepID=A0A8S3Z0F6_9EUPU|nr:unnamed protein product [Candidula unifasciata]